MTFISNADKDMKEIELMKTERRRSIGQGTLAQFFPKLDGFI